MAASLPLHRSPAEISTLLNSSILPIARSCLAPEALQNEIRMFKRLNGETENEPANIPVNPDAEKAESSNPVDSSSAAEISSNPPEGAEPIIGQKRPRGNNKVHERKVFKTERDPQKLLCAATACGTPCFYGEKCKFSHDIPAFLASRPPFQPGLIDQCPFHVQNIVCKFGFQCRWLSSHFSEESGIPQLVRPAEPRPLIAFNQITSTGLKALRLGNSKENEAKVFPLTSALMPHLQHYNATLRALIKERERSANHNQLKAAEAKRLAERAAAPASEEKRPEPRPFELADPKDFSSDDVGALCPTDRKSFNFTPGLLYLAPLTTLGHLPFRRMAVRLGADITCGEMSMCTAILQGSSSEIAHARRHPEEKIFGLQLAGSFPDSLMRCTEFVNEYCPNLDFLCLNSGCPIDTVTSRGMGAALCRGGRTRYLEPILQGMSRVSKVPIFLKCRLGWNDNEINVREILAKAARSGVAALTIHGRTRSQRYTKRADWPAIRELAKEGKEKYNLPVIGNGDVYTFRDYEALVNPESSVACVMIGRAALHKPWIFTEIKERRDWDISSHERMELLKLFSNFCLEYFGSDMRGVETSRRFLLEYLSFTCRYTPVGVLETVEGGEKLNPAMNLKPPKFVPRDDLEGLMASKNSADWVKLSEMILGPAPEGFKFLPKHKSNAYEEEGAAGEEENG